MAQLARSIGAIARREWSGANGELKETRRLSPVLIVHDQRVSFPGIAPYLNLEFRKLLGDVPPGCQVEKEARRLWNAAYQTRTKCELNCPTFTLETRRVGQSGQID